MNFFKSVFSDDPDPSESKSDNAPYPQNAPDHDSSTATATDATSSTAIATDTDTDNSVAGGSWNFGGLLQTITSRSESIIETYRRDLQEFGTGLKKEIEVAHGSLETVGHAIDQIGSTVAKGTAQIISQGKDAILAVDLDSDINNKKTENKRLSGEGSFNSKGYNRFETQLRAVQGDASTYCEDPEDLDEYTEWKLGFSLEGKDEEVEGFLRENEAMESIYKKVVPSSVDRVNFWFRYYYKVYKLKKAEDLRARLVKTMAKDDEDLSWDVEDDDSDDEEEEEEENVGKGKQKLEDVTDNKEVGGEKMATEGGSGVNDSNFDEKGDVGAKRLNVEEKGDSREVENKENSLQSKELTNESVVESKVDGSEVVKEVGDGSSSSKEAKKEVQVGETVNKNDSAAAGSDKKVTTETKVEDGKSSSVAAAASKPSAHQEEEEDLEWDEIEDLSAMDEKKTRSWSESPSKVDLRKRLSAAEEEEDLSWDIEDDDDVPAKA